MERLASLRLEGRRTDLPDFRAGDTVKVMVRVREGEKERQQAFEGVCIGKRGGGVSETFTVRKISAGVGVERIFPLHSPGIRLDRGRAPGQGTAGEALLPPAAGREGRAHPRAA